MLGELDGMINVSEAYTSTDKMIMQARMFELFALLSQAADNEPEATTSIVLLHMHTPTAMHYAGAIAEAIKQAFDQAEKPRKTRIHGQSRADYILVWHQPGIWFTGLSQGVRAIAQGLLVQLEVAGGQSADRTARAVARGNCVEARLHPSVPFQQTIQTLDRPKPASISQSSCRSIR